MGPVQKLNWAEADGRDEGAPRAVEVAVEVGAVGLPPFSPLLTTTPLSARCGIVTSGRTLLLAPPLPPVATALTIPSLSSYRLASATTYEIQVEADQMLPCGCGGAAPDAGARKAAGLQYRDGARDDDGGGVHTCSNHHGNQLALTCVLDDVVGEDSAHSQHDTQRVQKSAETGAR